MLRSPRPAPIVRVVADTNTVLSAFLWGGPPAAVLAAAREGRITLFTSPVLLAELEDVLSREKFAERIRRVGSSVAQILAGYRVLVTIVRPAAIEPTVRDPDDDHVLACAAAAQAQLIVSRDKDLLDLRQYRGTTILASADALRRLDTPQHNS
jgi:putative PIN family toxin of toxin-antitoxin system